MENVSVAYVQRLAWTAMLIEARRHGLRPRLFYLGDPQDSRFGYELRVGGFAEHVRADDPGSLERLGRGALEYLRSTPGLAG